MKFGSIAICVLLSIFVSAAHCSPAASLQNGTVLLTQVEIEGLRTHPVEFRDLIKRCGQSLDYVPSPASSLSPPPHYTSSGENTAPNTSKPFEHDAQVAYREAACYLISGDETYATTSQRILDAWARTLRNFPTKQGQDALNFDAPYMVIAASWVRNANHWNSVSFDQFLKDTVLPNVIVQNENNHGMWGVLLEASGGVYLHDDATINNARQRWNKLLAGAIDQNGALTREIQRSDTDNFHAGPDKGKKGMAYTHYFMLPASMSAKIFADAGQSVWHTDQGELLQAAFYKAASWTLHPETFPYYASNHGNLPGIRSVSYFALLLKEYPCPDAQSVLKHGKIGQDGFLLAELFGG
jgi:hypothetical protein